MNRRGKFAVPLLAAAFMLAFGIVLHPFFHHSESRSSIAEAVSAYVAGDEGQAGRGVPVDSCDDDFCPICFGLLNTDIPPQPFIPSFHVDSPEVFPEYVCKAAVCAPPLESARAPPVAA